MSSMSGLSCHNCKGSLRDQKFKCSRCKHGLYCNKECQIQHWGVHKAFCGHFCKSKVSNIGQQVTIIGEDPENMKMTAEENRRNERHSLAGARYDNEIATTIKTFEAGAGTGGLTSRSAQRYFWSLYTSMNSRYQAFKDLLDDFRDQKIKKLSEWANLRMSDPPASLQLESEQEKVLVEVRKRVVTDSSSSEAKQKQDIERILDTEFKIQELLNEIGDLANTGMRLNDMWDGARGVLLTYGEEQAADIVRFSERFEDAKKDLEIRKRRGDETPPPSPSGSSQKAPPSTPQRDRALLKQFNGDVSRTVRQAINAKYTARQMWLKRIATKMEPIRDLIALADLKRDVAQLVTVFVADPLEFANRHMNIVLYGEPGTGKTEVGTRLGSLFYALGFITRDPGGKFRALSRFDFVSGILGQTVGRVQDMFLENLGSLMFIDEAYGLHTDKDDSYGSEAVHEITNELQVYKGLISVVIAGYRKKIQKNLFEENPGLPSRFPEQWDFRPYTAPELYQIFLYLAKKRNMKTSADDFRQTLINLLTIMNLDQYRMFKDANGRAMGTILSWILREVSMRRLTEDDAQERAPSTPIQKNKGKREEDAIDTFVAPEATPTVQELVNAFKRWAITPRPKNPQVWELVMNDDEGGFNVPNPIPAVVRATSNTFTIVPIPKRKRRIKEKKKSTVPVLDFNTPIDNNVIQNDKLWDSVVGDRNQDDPATYYDQSPWLTEDYDDEGEDLGYTSERLDSDAGDAYTVEEMAEMRRIIVTRSIPDAMRILDDLNILVDNYEKAYIQETNNAIEYEGEDEYVKDKKFKVWEKRLDQLWGRRKGRSKNWPSEPSKPDSNGRGGSFVGRQRSYLSKLEIASTELLVTMLNRPELTISNMPAPDEIEGVNDKVLLATLVNKAIGFFKATGIGPKPNARRQTVEDFKTYYAAWYEATRAARVKSAIHYFY